MRILATIGMVLMTALAGADDADFIDHGVGAPVAESRGVIVTEDASGSGLLLALTNDLSPRGWILLVNLDTGESGQFYYPEGVPNSAPFASLMSENGRFYTVFGKTFVEFDPVAREWLFHGVPPEAGVHVTGSAMCDGPGGRIFAGMHQNCQLISYDPETQELRAHGELDDAEHYVNTLVADDAGWLYAGIGTARQNVVALNPDTGERVQVPDEDQRVHGSGHVHVAADGNVYGRVGDTWWRLQGGEAEEIPADTVPAAQPTGAIGWGQKTGELPDGRKVTKFVLPDRYLELTHPDGEVERITFDYESEGASITSVATGPDGRIYASSCHPMHLVRYDPDAEVLTDLGGVPAIGGGNMCAMTSAGEYLYGAEYAGGRVWRYDPAAPWQPGAEEPNPVAIAQYKRDLCRPRACITDATERWVAAGGFAGYGLCGGGLAVHDRETDETSLLTHQELIPYQSTIAMDFLPSGDLVGATSILAPGGGHVQAEEAVLYILDWETRQVSFQTVPVPGARQIISVQVGSDGLVYGVAEGSTLFVFDPERREMVHTEDLSDYGGTPRQTLLAGPDGAMYGAFTASIVRIQPRTFEHEKLADVPRGISAGGAIHGGRLYYASGSHLWSYGLRAE